MKIIYEQNLGFFAKSLPCPLYIVGGYVRNYLIDNAPSSDVDLCAPMPAETLIEYLEKSGGKVVAHYKRTGTVVFRFDKIKYEYTSFRYEKYKTGGSHEPESVQFTDDITLDALRRDFKCNAIYYDLKNDVIVDPLGGVLDVKNKVLDTVKEPEKVFCSDGLRLLRLARFAGELGFTPTERVIESAKKYADNLKDISVERIWAELIKILTADTKYPFSSKDGHYKALKVLDQTRCLDVILPQLTLGRGMAQRSDYHNYDVLEHSLRCVLYSPKNIRIYALLHDVGKPKNMVETGKYYAHDKSGARLVKEILSHLKADKKTVDKAVRLTRLHMADMDGLTGENKVKRLIIDNYDILDDLLALKQADYSACKDDLGECLTVKRWKNILLKMQQNGTPFTLKELKIDPKTLMEMGYKGKQIGEKLNELLLLCQLEPTFNQAEFLLKKAQKDVNNVKKG